MPMGTKTFPFSLRPLPTVIATVLLLLLLHLLSTALAADEFSVMLDFLSRLKPPPSGWSSSTKPCSWKGVECDTSSHITSINLASSSISGTLPPDLSPLTSLKYISVQRNFLTGPMPSFANITTLQEINLQYNNFTSVPNGIFLGLPGLQTLSLSYNPNLKPWTFPDELRDSTTLVSLNAGNINLVGTIPESLGTLPSLQNVRLSYNNLTGPFPLSFGASGIQFLWINNQQQGLSGTIDVLSTMTQLSQAWLQDNLFTGAIPDLSKCVNLFDLQLRDNQLTGIVPPGLMLIPSLQNVTLGNNKLQGPVPDNPRKIQLSITVANKFCNPFPGPCDPQVTILLEIAADLGYPATLADSWEGNDACRGWSFVTCTGKNVTDVNFSKQRFVGKISPAFGNLTSLQRLYLNDNNLTGPIPQSLTKLPQLKVLDVSNNNLSGLVPVFPGSVKFTSSGNPLLGKVIADTSGSGNKSGSVNGNASPPESESGSTSSSSSSTVVIIAIVLAVVAFIGVVVFVLYKCCYAKRKKSKFGRIKTAEWNRKVSSLNGGFANELQKQKSENHGDLISEGGNVVIPIDILKEVTDDFNEHNIIGRGGFGVVYKGMLHDGTMIAVKRMETSVMGTKGINEFQAEISVLTKVRHRNLVALLGYCVNGDERLLVYEYMPKGTLTQCLFEWKEMGSQPIAWSQRVKIALDVARGIEYLHGLAQQSFIHRDLKPSNILLDDDMRAKVADFGLVKNSPDGKISVETRLAGTFGYLAPEYAATGRVTTKVDVYAFGIVLMELITGRKSLDDSLPVERSHLVSWFRRIIVNKENIEEEVDPYINPDQDTMESIWKVAELAGHCTARDPHQRPDMSHAVNVLAPLVEQWKPSNEAEDSFGIDLHLSLPKALERWQSNEGTTTLFGTSSFSQSQWTSSGKTTTTQNDTFEEKDTQKLK